MATTEKKKQANLTDPIYRLGNIPGELTARGREVWLAGLGAFATVGDEGNRLFNTLVERGSDVEKRGKEQIDATVSELDAQQKKAIQTSKDTARDTAGYVEDIATRTVKTVLDRFDVPTRAEVKSLAEKVADLSTKINRLAVTLEKQSTGTPRQTTTTTDTDRAAYNVVPREEGWAVIKEGAKRATSVHETKKEALESGRELAKSQAPSTLTVHKQDGEVQETLTYDGEEQ